jgi:4-hydroxysphinganine ceramide fatty acyl 2-hydroxylase
MVTIEELIAETTEASLPDSSVVKQTHAPANLDDDREVKAREFMVYFDGVPHDIKAFLDLHPGGVDILEEYRGKDISRIMKDEGIHRHSEQAYSYLKKMQKNEKRPEDDDAAMTATNKLFDLERPLLWQIWTNQSITKKDYLRQVHRPILSKKSHRLFASDYLEILSKTPWWMIPLIWLPIITGLVYTASSMGLAKMSIGCLFFLGLFSWTLIEYLFHRFLFHIDTFLPSHRYFYTLHFLVHGVHHFMPIDPYRLVMPPALFFILACLVLPFLNALSDTLSVKMTYFSGILFGYVAYDLTHYYLHHANVLTHYMKSLKEYHMDHHFKNPNSGFGVTSKFWDLVFNS